ncbi:hypothetical protein JCM19239_4281 [Vibrio variabilis]|uniref:Response regulatory domain-containing protein n=1 Tax=Vibrio variabilis TaxID=990271 RepID=A0ABQ0JAJ4_9VIBR|nr:hypothetical protein JCM19239_4281 [Vibrio variabilis]
MERFEANPVDIVITDVSMGKMTGIALTQRLCARSKTVKVICLSMHNEQEYVESASKRAQLAIY